MDLTTPAGPLFTDLYELTMAAAYFAKGRTEEAVFSLFIRDDPKRPYFVAAGIDEAVAALSGWRFSASDLAYLSETGLFKPDFLDHLGDFRFQGDIFAVPEGTIVFGNEPLMEVTGPVLQAQIVETFLINALGVSTLIATKAARCIHAAKGRPLIDFSLRRTQGTDAGMKVARSTYIAGFTGTSNVQAGKAYGMPVSGTMAHSFIQALGDEEAAFAAYADVFPENAVFLIDTYDTLEGARIAARVADRMRENGAALRGVRLDSGDMADLSRKVRAILDDAGHPEVKIFASSGFDEFKIEKVLEDGAKIDAFGVGTRVGVSADAPYLDMVYKLVRCGGRDVRKLSSGKVTLAGPKQVFRRFGKDGRFAGDIIAAREEEIPDATPLLRPVMENGRVSAAPESLEGIRSRFAEEFSRLPEEYKDLHAPAQYPVTVGDGLKRLQDRLDEQSV